MKTIKVQLYVNKITDDLTPYMTYMYQYNLKHGIMLNFDITQVYTNGYVSVQQPIAAGGYGWVLTGADKLVPANSDDITMFLFDLNEWKTPWYSFYPLLPNTPRSSCIIANGKPFINLGFYSKDQAGTQVTMVHELMHAYTKIAASLGYPIVDQMDTYDQNANPDSPTGNFSIQWNNLKNWLNPTVSVQQSTINLIANFEGFKGTPYQDITGAWTIGYGFRTYNGVPVTASTPAITPAQAQVQLETQIAHYAQAVTAAIKVPLNQNQFDACVSLCYNIGTVGFASSTVAKDINASNFKGAADAFLLWDLAGGKVSQGLLNRRQKERTVFLS